MDYIPYNSRNTLHKSKFGALREGEYVVFKVVLPRSLCCSGVDLVIWSDSGDCESIPMSWLSMQGNDEEWWAMGYTAKKADIYFYHFEYHTPWGRMTIRHNGNCCGSLSMGREDWQLSVYSKDFTTPQWLKGGLFYQIFPDRFYSSGEEKKNVPADRVLRKDIFGEPEWRPNSQGKVMNNDYFCGDLKGIEEKLDYIESLGVTCIYLNPIFEAQSNHRYDTADYSKIDPLLGTENDLKSLCRKAAEKGISVILDGVFSHTGDDSVYFNKYGRYQSLGAFQSQESPYYKWYKFTDYPNEYRSWWGISILPEVVEESEEFLSFITGKDGIARRWLRCGVRGWRLDVADELPDVFLDEFRKAVKQENPEALVLGEVWEDASNKFSYGQRRHYFRGDELDSVMNYPFADAVIGFLRSGVAEGFTDKIMTILENYPKCVIDVLMNHIGTHDTMRAITALAGESCEYRDRSWQSSHSLSEQQYDRGIRLMKMASVIQYTLPGVPSLYYGDEAGMQGYKDPFNRFCYPWGRENKELLEHYRKLGHIRKNTACLKEGEYCTVSEMLGCLAYVRYSGKSKIMVIANRNDHEIDYYLPLDWHNCISLLGGKVQGDKVKIDALEAVILTKEENET
ncbi:MAG: glycoside hydrolase family 13 protein [Oscillospiraceae bacterium]|nr:glycoside hydrolase family 13 protein [Oscillospiraceae bacterium]